MRELIRACSGQAKSGTDHGFGTARVCAARGRSSCTPPTLRGLRFAVLRDEFQRDAVVAVAMAGRRRAVVEEMAMVAAAADAVVLDSRVDQVIVLLGLEDAGE